MIETKFKETEVGRVPADWEVKTIDELFDLGNGYTPSKANPNYWTNGTIPWFRMEDIRANGRILKDSIQHITPEAVKGGLFPANSIIMSTTATIGEHALLIVDSQANQQFTFLNRKVNRVDDIDIMYFFHYCYVLGEWCRANINAGGLMAVNIQDLKLHGIPLPPLPEQRRIATALSDIDSLISSLDELIEKKRNIKQGTMQQLLTGKTRLKGFSEPWGEKKLGDIGYTYNGLSGKSANDFGHGNAQYITFLNILNNVKIDTRILEKVSVDNTERQNAVQKGDLFFNTSSETPEEVGICSVLLEEMTDTYLNSFCFGYRVVDKEVLELYLSYYFRSRMGRELMSCLAQGSTRYNLSKDSFLKSSIIIPSTISEQRAIASILTSMDDEIAALEQKREKYVSLKQGMMQELLTGRIRLV